MLPDKTILVDLSYKGLICVSGPDAVPFLQGQLSTDIEKLTPSVTQLSSWSNAKGRVVAMPRLFRRGDDIYFGLPAGLKSTVLKRLSMYVLRSKVTLSDAGAEHGCLALLGADAAGLLAQQDLPVPVRAQDMTLKGTLQIMRLHGALPRYALYGPADEIAALKQRWEPSTVHGTEDDYALQRILAGEPTVHPETSEHFVAQMLDLEKFGALDFRKGCYTGQEVIARAHYRGGVKRHLARAASSGNGVFRPGGEIHAAGQDSPVAEVVDASRDSQGIWQMLLVVQDEFRTAPLLNRAGGAAVRILDAET